MAKFQFHLVAPDKITFSGEVDQVDVPGSEGDFGVMAGHAPTIALMRPGILTIHIGGERTAMVVLGGLAEINEDGLTVLANLADRVDEIDRSIIAEKIRELEAQIKEMEPNGALDKAIKRLDHFKQIDQRLTGTAMH
jgi:F-type H+-transporting ATPase subunit epsilon